MVRFTIRAAQTIHPLACQPPSLEEPVTMKTNHELLRCFETLCACHLFFLSLPPSFCSPLTLPSSLRCHTFIFYVYGVCVCVCARALRVVL